ISVTVIATTIISMEMYRTRSTYQASTLIEIGKEQPGISGKNGGIVIQSADDSDAIKTKILMVKSLPVLEDTVKNLKLDQDPNFRDSAQKESFGQAMKRLVGKAAGKDDKAAAKETDDTLVEETSGPGADKLEPFAAKIDKDLTVDLVRETRAIKISFTHTNPGVAADVANGVAKSFIDLNFQTQTQQFTNTSEWLKTSTRELLARVEKAEQDLANYTREHGIFSTEGKETLTTDKLSRLHDQATRAQTDRILMESRYQEVKAGRSAQLPEAFADSRIAALPAKQGELQTQLSQLTVRFGPKNPRVEEVKQQIHSLQEQIDAGHKALEDKLKGEYERAVRDEQALNSALAQAKTEAVKQNQDAIEYNVLKSNVDTAKSLYTGFLEKTNQANLEVAQQHSNMHVIQPAKAP